MSINPCFEPELNRDAFAPLLLQSGRTETLLFRKTRGKILSLAKCFFKKLASILPQSQARSLAFSISYQAGYRRFLLISQYNRNNFRQFLIATTTNLPLPEAVVSGEANEEAHRLHERFQEAAQKIPMIIDEALQDRTLGRETMTQRKTDSSFVDEGCSAPGGLCHAMVSALAQQRLQGQSWVDSAAQFSRGTNVETAGAQIWTNTERDCPMISSTSYREDRLGWRYGIVYTPQTMKSTHPSIEESLQEIAEFEDGVYKLNLHNNTQHGHALLFERAGDKTYVIDPNIGVLRCEVGQTARLLTLVIEVGRRAGIDTTWIKPRKVELAAGCLFYSTQSKSELGCSVLSKKYFQNNDAAQRCEVMFRACLYGDNTQIIEKNHTFTVSSQPSQT